MACRVEIRDLSPNASWQEREIAFKKMFTVFKKRVAEAGILYELKQREFYESEGVRARRKRKEVENFRLKQKLRESFPEQQRSKSKPKIDKGEK